MSDDILAGKFGKVCTRTLAAGIGQRFKELREAMFFTRENMAWKAGLPSTTLKNYELGYRSTDLDALYRFISAFKDEHKPAILRWLVFGRDRPNVTLSDTVVGLGLLARGKNYRLLKTPHGQQIALRVRHVREEVFALGRDEFSDKIRSDFSGATISDYENGRRSVSLEYVAELCNAATQPVLAWEYLLLGKEKPGDGQRAWFKIKNASLSGAQIAV